MQRARVGVVPLLLQVPVHARGSRRGGTPPAAASLAPLIRGEEPHPARIAHQNPELVRHSSSSLVREVRSPARARQASGPWRRVCRVPGERTTRGLFPGLAAWHMPRGPGGTGPGNGEARMREMGEAAAGWLVGRLGDMEEALAALVEVNSFTENPEGGRKVGALLREHFAMPGLFAEVVLEHAVRGPPRVPLPRQGRAGPPVALVGHLDTVFPPGKFEGYRKDGALRRGPGRAGHEGRARRHRLGPQGAGGLGRAGGASAAAAGGGVGRGGGLARGRRRHPQRHRAARRPASSSSPAGPGMPSSPGARAPAR